MRESQYRDLIAWQRAIDFVVDVYNTAEHFPNHERFGLTDQIHRAAVSVPSNIAEGRGRGTRRDYRNFLCQARGSLYEVETLVTLAQRLGYVTSETSARLLEKSASVARPLNGLIAALAPATRDPRPKPARDAPATNSSSPAGTTATP